MSQVDNKLTIKGNPVDLKRMLAEIEGKTDECGNPILIDFNKIVPMPHILKNTSTNSKNESCYANNNINQERKGGFKKYLASHRPFTKLEKSELDKIRFYNRYEWSDAHWGTPQNVNFIYVVHSKRNSICLTFDTVGSAPVLILQALCERYPNLDFTLRYEDGEVTTLQRKNLKSFFKKKALKDFCFKLLLEGKLEPLLKKIEKRNKQKKK